MQRESHILVYNNKEKALLPQTILLASTLLCTASTQAQTLTVAGGSTIRASNTEHDSYRLEMNLGWKPEIWSNSSWGLSLHHALSVMTFRDRNNVNAVSWAPNLILSPRRTDGLRPYIQLGFGAAYLSEDKFESEPKTNPDYILDGVTDMGSHWQFESSFAIGLSKGRFDIRAKVYHYSNAELADENEGMDVGEFGVSYHF